MREILTPTELIDWRRVLRTKITVDSVRYIDQIVFGGGYTKGEAHWDIIEHLCEYATGKTFEVDSSLYLCLHTQSQEITGHFEDEIGLDLCNELKEYSNRELADFGHTLAAKLIKLVDDLLINETSTLTLKHMEPTPTKLRSPRWGLIGL